MSSTTAALNPPLRAGRREWIGLAVIALPCLLYSMDLTVLNLAVPALARELQPTPSQLLWIIDIYGFMVAGMLVTMGTLGDRIGRRRLLLIGAAAFGVASVLAAASNSAGMLIATRALLGVAGATLAPSTLSLIRSMFHDPRQRTTAIGIWISSFSLGAAIGPVVGGALIEFFSWRAAFLINVPVMLLLLALGPSLLPEFRDPQARRIDLPSAAMSIAAVLPTIYGLKRLAEQGFVLDSPAALLPWAAMLAGLAVGVAFVHRQRRLAEPLIDLGLFRAHGFTPALVIYMTGGLVMFGVFVFIAQYLQLVLGLNALQAGWWMVPSALGFVVGSTVTPRLVGRVSVRVLIVGGLAISAVSLLVLAAAGPASGPALVVGGLLLQAIGMAPVFTLATELIVGSVEPERAGAASAMSETCAEFGGALGIAIFGSLGTAIYRVAMADADAGAVPAGAALDAARATLAGAASLAQQPGGSALLGAAHDAFVQGQRVTLWIGATLLAATAVMAKLTLRSGTSAPHGSEAGA
ncbi:MAG TPA: MFS transporter [Methylibium sp.]|uniref:MFS transporter n=1 Tax=Methylibium sp. TaxID=2067992 RepID=UPI002DB78010|nr:MFS transporter [Methylibium sp.]HEU4458766.1 MFS transporter [Methylibium sp.]